MIAIDTIMHGEADGDTSDGDEYDLTATCQLVARQLDELLATGFDSVLADNIFAKLQRMRSYCARDGSTSRRLDWSSYHGLLSSALRVCKWPGLEEGMKEYALDFTSNAATAVRELENSKVSHNKIKNIIS